MRTPPALARLLCALALAVQIALPAAHGWEVSRAEASHPSESWAAGASSLAQDGPRRHHHHDEGSCAVCPILARLSAIPGSSAPSLAPSPRPLGSAAPAGSLDLSESILDAFLSRGPPAA